MNPWVPKVVSVRLDDEIRTAIEQEGEQLGTRNLSQILRVVFMVGHERTAGVADAISRRAFKEGVLSGVNVFKANLEAAVARSLDEGDA